MTTISKRLDQIIKKELSLNLIPQKTDQGIVVGDVVITAEGSIKTIKQASVTIYSGIYLNSVTVCLANRLALRKSRIRSDEIYELDQEYGRLFTDSQILRDQYQKALSRSDHDRADILWARYCQSRDRAAQSKSRVESLISI
jgi:hypothetical protein